MNRITYLVLLLMLSAASLKSQNYMVSGAGDSLSNGLYVEMGINEGRPFFKKDNYFMFFTSYLGCNDKWVIMKDSLDMIYKCYDWSNVPPMYGWMETCNQYSVYPPPTVYIEGRALIYNYTYSVTYSENQANDGSVSSSDPLLIALNGYAGETFTGTVGDDFYAQNKVEFTGVPVGLVPVVEKLTDTLLSLSFTGNAQDHGYYDDVGAVGMQFNNLAFSGGDISLIAYNNYSNISFDFGQSRFYFPYMVFTEDSSDVGCVSNNYPYNIWFYPFGGEQLNGAINEDFVASGKVNFHNLPNGLIAQIIKTTETTLQFSINGCATNHDVDDGVCLNLAFTDSAFTLFSAEDIYGYNSYSDILIKFIDVIGVENIETASKPKIFPVPATDVIHLKHKSHNKPCEVKIFDMHGNLVLREACEGSINISGLPVGQYILNIEDVNGSYHEKIVKH